ncbi:hypothetical protein CBZ97_007045 [Salmonella enterica]|nr:hypothetical protein [Salmonella enterica]VEA96151.1 fimbrial protein [Salmonella enterica subsp. houtenae]
MFNKTIIITLAFLFSSSALAVQKDITVNATVDSSVNITKADGTMLPAAVRMDYFPGVGLAPVNMQTKIWSNTANKAIRVSLASQPNLTSITSSAPAIPLSVKFDNTTLTTTATDFAYARLFPTGTTDGSIALPLTIEQATRAAIPASGEYSGMVSLVLTVEP